MLVFVCFYLHPFFLPFELIFDCLYLHSVFSYKVMLMASLQKYFSYDCGTRCGIPGVEMTGKEEDWIRLAEKTKKLEALLMPIMEDIGLDKWLVFKAGFKIPSHEIEPFLIFLLNSPNIFAYCTKTLIVGF